MKLFLFVLIVFLNIAPLAAQEVYSANENDTATPAQEKMFSDELVSELLTAQRKRYAGKDMQTLKLRQSELEKTLRRRSSLPSETRQRLELEWYVILQAISQKQTEQFQNRYF